MEHFLLHTEIIRFLKGIDNTDALRRILKGIVLLGPKPSTAARIIGGLYIGPVAALALRHHIDLIQLRIVPGKFNLEGKCGEISGPHTVGVGILRRLIR